MDECTVLHVSAPTAQHCCARMFHSGRSKKRGATEAQVRLRSDMTVGEASLCIVQELDLDSVSVQLYFKRDPLLPPNKRLMDFGIKGSSTLYFKVRSHCGWPVQLEPVSLYSS